MKILRPFSTMSNTTRLSGQCAGFPVIFAIKLLQRNNLSKMEGIERGRGSETLASLRLNYFLCDLCLEGRKGRKKACVTYCITYLLSCMTKHSPQYKILMVGRIM